MTGRRRAWIASIVIAGLAMIAGLALCFASTLGIERLPLVAGLIGPRNAVTMAAAVVCAIAAVGAIVWRRARPVAASAAVALAVCVAASGAVLWSRATPDEPPAPPGASDLRVLSWNTNGDLVDPAIVAAAASRAHANVVVLPEIVPSRLDAYASALTAVGLRLTPYRVDASSQVVVFVADALGTYRPARPGPHPAKDVVLAPDTAGSPTIVALHAAQPALTANGDWNADLRWVESECARPDVVAIGDFNATVDSLGGSRLGGCEDAASATGQANIGTWPSAVPVGLGIPLDHALASQGWHVVRFTVIRDEDASGARHRPIFVEFAASR